MEFSVYHQQPQQQPQHQGQYPGQQQQHQFMNQQHYGGGNHGGGAAAMPHPIRNRIYVGNIPQNASQDELREYFGFFGSIKDARIIMDQVGQSRGFGFVTYDNENDALKVLAQRDQDFIFKDVKLNIGQAFRQNNQNNYNNNNNYFNRMNGGGGGGGAGGAGGPGGQQGNFNFQRRQPPQQRFN